MNICLALVQNLSIYLDTYLSIYLSVISHPSGRRLRINIMAEFQPTVSVAEMAPFPLQTSRLPLTNPSNHQYYSLRALVNWLNRFQFSGSGIFLFLLSTGIRASWKIFPKAVCRIFRWTQKWTKFVSQTNVAITYHPRLFGNPLGFPVEIRPWPLGPLHLPHHPPLTCSLRTGPHLNPAPARSIFRRLQRS